MHFVTAAQQTKTYTVVPARYVTQNGRRELVYGLRAKFEGGKFDSEMAQKQNRWSDEERKQVEAYLLSHFDFGGQTGIFLADTSDVPDYILEQIPTDLTTDSTDNHRACVFAVRFGDSSEVCGRRAIGDSPYCEAHGQLITTLPKAPTKRGRALVEAEA